MTQHIKLQPPPRSERDWGRIEHAFSIRERNARLNNETALMLSLCVISGLGMCAMIYAVLG